MQRTAVALALFSSFVWAQSPGKKAPSVTLAPIAPEVYAFQDHARDWIQPYLLHFAKQHNPSAKGRDFGDKLFQSLVKELQAPRRRPSIALVPIGNRKVGRPARRQNDKFKFR